MSNVLTNIFRTIPANLFPAVLVLAITSTAFAGPGISIADATFKFGKIPQRATVNHTFWLKSNGDETLRITEIVPGCGCTRAPLADSVLAPGDSAALVIQFDSKSYRGFVSKKPYLITNIGEDRIYLQIHSEIMPEPELMQPVKLKPYILDVSQFTVKPRTRARAWVINESASDLNLKIVDDIGKSFTVEFPDMVKANDSAEILVTVKKEAIETEFNESFTFEISDDLSSRFSLPVKRMYRIPRAVKGDK